MNMMSRVAAGTALATLPPVGIAGQAIAATPDRAAWDSAMIDWARCKRIADETGAAYDRAWKAVEAEAPQPEPFTHPFTSSEHHRVLLYTADLKALLARFERVAPSVFIFPPEAANRHVQEARQIVEQINAFREAREAADARHGEKRLGEAYEDAIIRQGEAGSVLLQMPAPDAAALLWKLEYMWGEDVDTGVDGGSYCHEWMAALMADARRLLAAGRA